MSNKENLKIANQILNNGFVNLSLEYARLYKLNPKEFINTYKNNKSVKNVCSSIVLAYKSTGMFQQCIELANGKTFTEYAKKHTEEQYVESFADILLILYSIIK